MNKSAVSINAKVNKGNILLNRVASAAITLTRYGISRTSHLGLAFRSRILAVN